MSDGFISRVPDVSGLLSDVANLDSDIEALTDTFASLTDSGTPVSAVTNAISGLADKVDVDVSGLTEQLPGAVNTITNALPANTIQFVESLADAYATVQGFLQDSELVEQIGDGGSLQDLALAAIADALAQFDDRLNELSNNLINADALAAIGAAAAVIDQLRNDFSSNQVDFLPFVTEYLLGISPDVLDGPRAHVDALLAVLAPLDAANLAASLTPQRVQLSEAFSALVAQIESFDAADANAYAQIQVHLDAIETASNLLFATLSTLYDELEALIESSAWDTFFSVYVGVLDAVAFGDVPTLDDFVNAITEMLEDLIARSVTAFGTEEVGARLTLVTQNMRDAVLASPLAQIRVALQGFLGEIEAAIDGIPTEDVQQQFEDILGRIEGALVDLDLGQIEASINAEFQAIDNFINANINSTLTTAVGDAMAALAGEVERLPLAGILTQLTNAIAELDVLVNDLEAAIGVELDTLENALARLETLSFKPLSDEVIVEIDDVKGRLQAINPDALSDVERLAIVGVVAALEAIDLDGQVVNALKDGYDEVESGVKRLLDQITAALERLKESIAGFSPDVLLEPATNLLDEAAAQVEQLNGRALVAPLYDRLQVLSGHFSALSPGQLLEPLQAPYDSIAASIERIDPNTWVAPIHDLHAEINRLVDLIDVTPLLDDLDQRQRDLFDNARSGILAALDALTLPEPFASFFAGIRPVIELMTDAIFRDPGTALDQLNLDLQTRVDLSALFAPLDDVFAELVDLIESVPAEDLTTTMNTIRQSVGVGLEVLDPQAIIARLRNGSGRLAELAPTQVLGGTLSLPALQVAFEARAADAPSDRLADVAAVSARFGAVISVTTPQVATGQMQQLIEQHNAAREALRLRINQLDHSSAADSYIQLRRNLDRLLPPFLRQPDTLTHTDILAGIHAMRPSAKAGVFEDSLERLLQQLEPMQTALEPAFNDFVVLLREILVMINPLAIRDDVGSVYDTLRAKLQILDPDRLAAALEPIWNNLTAPVAALNPAELAARIDATFQNALNALVGPVELLLDEITALIDDQLRAIRAAVLTLLSQVEAALTGSLGSVDAVLKRIEGLIFVGVLERLCRVIDNLGTSFDAELDRVSNAFDAMLAAIPVDTGRSVSAAA